MTAEAKLDLERKGVQSYQRDIYARFLCFGTGKAVVLHFLDTAVAGGIPHEPFQYQPDSGFTLAAFANDEHHLLPLGAGDQAVA